MEVVKHFSSAAYHRELNISTKEGIYHDRTLFWKPRTHLHSKGR